MLYFHPTLSLKDERRGDRFGAKLKIQHTTNDLPIFSPQKRNLEIGPSERLLPIFGTKDRILKIGSCERALRERERGGDSLSLLFENVSIIVGDLDSI